MKLSIIIPVYNEEKTVAAILKRVNEVKIPGVEKEIIIVNDGSTDGTASKIRHQTSDIRHLQVLTHAKNQGKGAAVRTGLEKATGEYIVIQDADLEYDPRDIIKLIEPVKNGKAQVVYGTRLKRLPNFSRDERTVQFLIHYLGNKFLSLVTSILYFSWVTDMETCYKLFPKEALKGITLHARGFELEPEITAKLLKKGYKIYDVPISTNPRGYDEGKKINTVKDGIKALLTLIRYRFSDPYELVIAGIIMLTIFLRFYNYNERWGIAYDQAHDALIAHYAVESFNLPLLGPFSSAGPFQTGGEWYWIIMLGTAISPHSILAPWTLITILYVLFVYIIILVGKEIGGKTLGIITGFFAAISTAQIAQGTNLTNQSPMALVSLFGIWSAVLYLKKQKARYLFLLGLCVGVASSIHLSGAGLLALVLSLFIFYRRFNYKTIGAVLLGIFIPWLPVLIADSQNNFMNTSNILYYNFYGKYAIPLEALGRRWLTYLGAFWPEQWAFIIGGHPIIGYLIFVSLSTLIFLREMIKKEMVMILMSILGMIVLLRYTHTPLFASYLVFMHPFIILSTAWIVFILLNKKRILGISFLAVITAGTLYGDYVAFKGFENSSSDLAEASITKLKSMYKDKKFAVYTYKSDWKDKNYILSLYLTKQNLIDKNGIKISTIVDTKEDEFGDNVIYGNKGTYQVISINSSSSAELKKQGWKFVDAEVVYNETENWFKIKKDEKDF